MWVFLVIGGFSSPGDTGAQACSLMGLCHRGPLYPVSKGGKWWKGHPISVAPPAKRTPFTSAYTHPWWELVIWPYLNTRDAGNCGLFRGAPFPVASLFWKDEHYILRAVSCFCHMDLVTCLLIVWYTGEHASLQRTPYHTEKSSSPNINYIRHDTTTAVKQTSTRWNWV